MGIIIIFFIFAIFGFGIYYRTKKAQRQMDAEAAYLYDYVVKKCERNGLDNQEAKSIAENYAEDFISECHRNVNIRWGSVFAVKRAISSICSEFTSEIDARFR